MLVNREDGRETYYSKIKSARSSNYDTYRAFAELLDNSIDASPTNIQINIEYNIDGMLNKIFIFDNGKGIKNLIETATHGYSRIRNENEGGEFGHGYKLALINLSDKATYVTKHTDIDQLHIGIWEQQTMAENDCYLPECTKGNIESKECYKHYFKNSKQTGTLIILENLIQNTMCSFDVNKLILYIVKRYHLFILDSNKNINFDINDKINGNSEITTINKDNLFDFKIKSNSTNCNYIYDPKYDEQQNIIYENYIIVLKNIKSLEYSFFVKGYSFNNLNLTLIQTPNTEADKKGNWFKKDYKLNLLKEHEEYELLNGGEYKKIDEIKFITKDLNYFHISTSELDTFKTKLDYQVQEGRVDIFRKGFTITDNGIYYRGIYNDGYANYIYHQLYYQSPEIDKMIGTNVNKQNNGSTPNLDLYKILHYIQKHSIESMLRNKRYIKMLDKNKIDEFRKIESVFIELKQDPKKSFDLSDHDINNNKILHPLIINNLIKNTFDNYKKIKKFNTLDNYTLIIKILEYNITIFNEIKNIVDYLTTIKKHNNIDYFNNKKSRMNSSKNIDIKKLLDHNKILDKKDISQVIFKVFNKRIDSNTNESLYTELNNHLLIDKTEPIIKYNTAKLFFEISENFIKHKELIINSNSSLFNNLEQHELLEELSNIFSKILNS